MSDKKISALTALATIAAGDLLVTVDVSDTTQAASGTTKKITVGGVLSAPSPIGSVTPSSGAFTTINTVVLSGASTPTLAVTGTTTVSGANTGDQTITLTGDVTGSGTGSFATAIASGVIVNADVNASAAIVDTKLATISTALKVSNSATTAASANTASAIVARDASGNFTAGTITAALTGNATTVTTNADLTGHVTSVGNAAVLGSFTSAQLAAALSDETGSGASVFATSPVLTTPNLGTPSAVVLTNASGTASININGTVGATTAASGAFTSLSSTTGANLATSSGNVGIGTTTPEARLNVEATALSAFTGTSDGIFRIQADTGVNEYTALDFGSRSAAAGASAHGNPLARIASQVTSPGSSLHFGTSNLYSTGITNTAMTINHIGDVGIGTTSPAHKLQVKDGTFAIEQTGGGAAQLYIDGSGVTNLYTNTQIFINANASGGNLTLQSGTGGAYTNLKVNGGTEAVRIVSNGDVGIGTVTPTQKLEVTGTAKVTTLMFGDATTMTTAGAAASHTHAAADIVSGTVATARLGSGTASSGNFLRGDSSWVSVGGGGDMLAANNLADLTNSTTARTNLSLGTMATQAASAVAITGGTISNSATTATNLNTASAIVARDASGNFTAGTITAALTGTASGNLVSGGALGTPSSGTVTNLTGTASININGTVGATTATSGAFTTVSATGITTVAAGTAALPAIVSTTGTADTGLWFPAADTLAASTAGSERIRISSTGNVGIGTTSPNTKLAVIGDVAIGTASAIALPSGLPASSQTLSIVSTGTAYGTGILARRGGDSYTGFNLWNHSYGTYLDDHADDAGAKMYFRLRTAGTPVTAMTLAASGNVGIGTTSPAATLDVVGTAKINGLNIGYLNIPQTGSAKTASYSLVVGDVGKFVELGTGGTIVVPASVFAAGDVVSMVNNTAATIACTCSAITTVYKGGTDTNISSTGFSITTRGMATLFFVNATTAVVTGNLA